MARLSEHFATEEFVCKCGCGLGLELDTVSLLLVDLLERIRAVYGRPMHITSGLRCAKHNAEVGGSPASAHMRGLAADIRVSSGHERYELLRAAFAVGCKRIGDGPVGAVHFDVDSRLPQEVCWIYPGKRSSSD